MVSLSCLTELAFVWWAKDTLKYLSVRHTQTDTHCRSLLILFCHTLPRLSREEMATLDVWERREASEVNGNTNTLTAESCVPFTPAHVSSGLSLAERDHGID